MKTITLIRHGQSQEQSGEVTDGMNPELSQLGIWQSKQLKQRLQGQRFDLALVSPLDRAFQTFAIVEPNVERVELDSRLIETDYVENWYEPMVGYSPDQQLPIRNERGWLVAIKQRAKEFMGELLELDQKDIVVFGHQGIIKHLIAEWLEISVESLTHNLLLDNTSLTGFMIDQFDKRIVTYINDAQHLKNIPDRVHQT